MITKTGPTFGACDQAGDRPSERTGRLRRPWDRRDGAEPEARPIARTATSSRLIARLARLDKGLDGTSRLKTAGTQSVTATDTKTASIKGSQTGILVKPGAAKTLVVSGLTTPRTKGVAGSIRVTAVDAYGNRVSGYTGTIHFTSTDAKAVLPANYKFKASDAGTHVFSVTLKTAGTQWVRARDTVTSTITGVQGGIVVK
jgi:hypothetical protein